MKSVDVTQLNGHCIVRWVGTEMALSDGAVREGPVLWAHPAVPYLQLVSLDIQLDDGSVYRMLSQSGDGSGYYGLYLLGQDAIDTPSSSESGSIYRTRELSELPVGSVNVAVTELDGPNAVLRVELGIGGRTMSCWAAEVYERDEENFEVCGGDESILIQVDGFRPDQKIPTHTLRRRGTATLKYGSHMSLKEKLRDFAGALASATDAPDDYPALGYVTYESNMADLKEFWAMIRPKLKRDLEQAEFVDGKLEEAFAAFEANEKDKGRKAILAIYNLDVKQFR